MYRAVRTSVFARLLLAATLLAGTMLNTAVGAMSNSATDWPTYLHDVQRQAASAETFLSTSNAGLLTPLWTYKTGGTVGASPTIVNNVVYEGSWDGYEYALNATNGQVLWKTYLGVTNVSGCVPPNAGVDSSAAVQNGVVYVGGGGNESGSNTSYWYALDASTGNILWKVPIGDNSPSGGNFNWSSPLLYNGYAYIGVASLGDCPLVQGKLLKVSLSTHQVVAEADLAAAGNRGNGVWTSPSVDPATNTIVVSTGTWDYQGDPLGQAVISLNADTLAVIGHWQPPLSEQVFDGDFGVTPLLYTDANGRQMVATINKNGIVYALQEGNLGAGPVWQQQISTVESPGNVSSGAYGQGLLFEAGSGDVINGTQYYGSINAFDPTTGQFIWRVGLQHDVTPPLAYMNGLILLGDGPNFEIRNASNGDLLYDYTTPSDLYAAPSISNGRIFLGTTDGRIIAFGLNTTPPPAPVPGQPLSLPFNNEGVSNNGSATSTNYDNVGYTYSSQALAAAGINSGGTATANGVTFQWPTTGPGMNDNAIAQGQTITLTSPTGGSALAFLGSATNGPSSGTGSILYTDGTSQAFNLTFSDWTLNGGNATGPDPSNSIAAHVTYRNNSQGEADLVATYLFSASVQLQAGKQVQAVILPQGANTGLLHVFAITLVTPSSAASSTPSPTSSPTATATLTPTTTSTGTPTATATASATAPTPTRTPTVKGHGKGHK